MARAEARDTSCSPLRPPKTTITLTKSPLLSSPCIVAKARTVFLSPLRREAELVRATSEGASHELYVLVEVDAKLLGSTYDVVAVHGRGEGLLLHLLADAFGLHVLQALGAHHGAGHDKAGEFVHGIERLGHESVARYVQVVSVALYSVEHVFGITQSLQLPDPHHRMPVLCRMLLVVHVVQEAGHTPFLLILAKAACVGPHGGLNGEHVLAQRVALGPFAHEVPGVFLVHDLSHGISLRLIGFRLQVAV